MQQEKKNRLKKKGILVLDRDNEKEEIEFELNYLSTLSTQERFALMIEKSRELKTNLEKNGHRRTPTVIKRK
ncbi:MAG: hypothetical protein R6V02_05650 [Candidatus Aminicenantes bacterium]